MKHTQQSALIRVIDWALPIVAVAMTVMLAVSCIGRSVSHSQIDSFASSLAPPEPAQTPPADSDKAEPADNKSGEDKPKPKGDTTTQSESDKDKPTDKTPDKAQPDKPDKTQPDKPDKTQPDKPDEAKPKKPTPEKAKPAVNPDDETVKRIVARSMFCPVKPKAFSAKLTGVIGDAAIFNGSQLVVVGGSVGGGKLLEIGADWVEVEFEGNKQKQWVFGKGGGPSPPGAPGPPAGAAPSPRGGRGAMRGGRSRGGMPPGFELTK